MTTTWTLQRLERLYARYNRQFCEGRLPHIPVCIAQIETLGLYEVKPHRITLKIADHQNDREVRTTLSHEMAHAAVDDKGSKAHGSRFWGRSSISFARTRLLPLAFPKRQA